MKPSDWSLLRVAVARLASNNYPVNERAASDLIDQLEYEDGIGGSPVGALNVQPTIDELNAELIKLGRNYERLNEAITALANYRDDSR